MKLTNVVYAERFLGNKYKNLMMVITSKQFIVDEQQQNDALNTKRL